MELVTASDLVVTASLALLLSFLIAKLVSFAISTDPNTTTINQLNQLCHVSVEPLTVQTESKVHLQLPTDTETDHDSNEGEKRETKVEPNAVELSVTPDIAVEVSDVTQEFDSEAVGSADLEDSVAEQMKTDCDSVEEIIVEKSSSVEEEEEERDVVLDDDDWEAIEMSEFGSDVEKELYGLHKIATEGTCRQSQPMPLMLSARAKWNAWQKLGNMSPEVAMEQYISLVSDKDPAWMKDTSAGMSEHEPTGSEILETVADLSTSLSHQQMMLTDRELEQEKESSAQDHSPPTESDLENNVKK